MELKFFLNEYEQNMNDKRKAGKNGFDFPLFPVFQRNFKFFPVPDILLRNNLR